MLKSIQFILINNILRHITLDNTPKEYDRNKERIKQNTVSCLIYSPLQLSHFCERAIIVKCSTCKRGKTSVRKPTENLEHDKHKISKYTWV